MGTYKYTHTRARAHTHTHTHTHTHVCIGSMTAMTHIDLSHNGLGDLGATNLSHALQYFAELRGLELDSNDT